MNWYKTLDINRRIALKECCEMLVGHSFADLIKLRIVSFVELIEILHYKLILHDIIKE